ncbi:MAG: hypothetical protein EB120_10830 [Proteobacteria bacterium]|nr:hypothetical protein [Pseudomonadota bacterium]
MFTGEGIFKCAPISLSKPDGDLGDYSKLQCDTAHLFDARAPKTRLPLVIITNREISKNFRLKL